MHNKKKLFKIFIFTLIPMLLIFTMIVKEVLSKELIKKNLESYKQSLVEEKLVELMHSIEFIKQTININLDIKKDNKKSMQYKEKVLQYIEEMSINEKDYYWVTDSKLNIIMHPINKEYESKNIKDISSRFQIDIPLSKLKSQGRAYLDYSLILNKEKSIDKLGAIIMFEPWEWGIVKSIEITDINQKLKILEDTLIENYEYTMRIVSFLTLIFTLLTIYIVIRQSNLSIFMPIENNIKKLNNKLIKKNKELKRRLYHDDLTGLGNLELLKDDISKVDYTCLLLIDIDSFDNINKLYGYHIGDKVLIKYARVLDSFSQKNSFKAYRLYSNTFALQGLKDSFKIEDYHRNILDLIHNHTKIKLKKDYEKDINLEISLDVNIGVCLYQDKVIMKAKTALEEAKRNSKRYFIYHGELNEKYKVEKYLDIKQIIERAIEKGTIIPFFQPIVDKSKKIVKYESLMRIDQNGNILAPFSFMDVAIRTKLYSKISIIMIEETLKKVMEHKKNVSINLSTVDIANKEFSSMLDLYLNDKNIELCKLITFEILEDQSVDDIDFINSFLMKYRRNGVKVAIDDFGTGYSNFLNILTIKPDYIKIDGSLIKNIDKNSNNIELIKSIVNFARTLKIITVAEFVHNEKVFNICKEIGIDRFQGYYFNKPQENFIES